MSESKTSQQSASEARNTKSVVNNGGLVGTDERMSKKREGRQDETVEHG